MAQAQKYMWWVAGVAIVAIITMVLMMSNSESNSAGAAIFAEGGGYGCGDGSVSVTECSWFSCTSVTYTSDTLAGARKYHQLCVE